MDAAIGIHELVKRYGDALAVDGVSLVVHPGETFGYLGPNGAGKTTTIRCLLGLIAPTGGRVRVLGRDPATELAALLGDVGYLPGEFNLWPQLTGTKCLDYLAALHPRPPERRAELCDRLELAADDLGRQVRFYSRGMKQKLGIVQALQHRPPVLILDEPTEGLDPVMKDRFLELLVDHRTSGGTTFLSSHILSEVEQVVDRVGIVRAGRLVKVGAVADLTGARVRHCTLLLKEPAPPGILEGVPGVSGFRADGLRFRFDVTGDMEPLLRALAPLHVAELLSEPERLTESFFEIYEGGTP